MRTFKARGIVLKETFSGESNKTITLLLKERGKISVSARGARKQKSKFMAGTALFCYADFIIYEGNGFYSLTQCDLIESFYTLRNDIVKLSYASYLLELTDQTSPVGLNCDEILLLLLKSLTVMSKSSLTPPLIARIFEFRLLALSGFCPETSVCAYCGEAVTATLHFGSNGLLCQGCKRHESGVLAVSPTSIYTLHYIITTDFNSLFQFNVSAEILEELKKMSIRFMNEHLNVTLPTYSFIETLEKF